jgi:uncharacterized OB-fold protein
MSETVRDAGYADLLDAIADGEGYYIECENGHGSLPPRHVCPECASQELTQERLPDSGEIETLTVIHATTPAFSDDTPYVTAVVDFGPIELTGRVPEADPESIETGLTVTPTIGESETTGDRSIAFRLH